MTGIAESILTLDPTAQVSINAEDLNQITWHDGNPNGITAQQITEKQAELQTKQAAASPPVATEPSALKGGRARRVDSDPARCEPPGWLVQSGESLLRPDGGGRGCSVKNPIDRAGAESAC